MQIRSLVGVLLLCVALPGCKGTGDVLSNGGTGLLHSYGSCDPEIIKTAAVWAETANATAVGQGGRPLYRVDATATSVDGEMVCAVRIVSANGAPLPQQRQQRPQGERRQHRGGDDGHREEREHYDRSERSGGQGVLRRNYEDPRNYARQNPRRPY